jgi:hypothetical protein
VEKKGLTMQRHLFPTAENAVHLDTHRRSIKIQDKKAQQQLQRQLAQLQALEDKKNDFTNFAWKGFTWKHFYYWSRPEDNTSQSTASSSGSNESKYVLFLFTLMSEKKGRQFSLLTNYFPLKLYSSKKEKSSNENKKQKEKKQTEQSQLSNNNNNNNNTNSPKKRTKN